MATITHFHTSTSPETDRLTQVRAVGRLMAWGERLLLNLPQLELKTLIGFINVTAVY